MCEFLNIRLLANKIEGLAFKMVLVKKLVINFKTLISVKNQLTKKLQTKMHQTNIKKAVKVSY